MDRFPRLSLARLPTPLEPLERLSDRLGGPSLLVKRDDLTGLGMGGNKIRKLEYLVAEARSSGADTLVTVGGVQSNHCRQTAATAACLGLACELILVRVVPGRNAAVYEQGGNVLLDGLFGARVHVLDDPGQVPATVQEIERRVAERGGSVAFFPPGGSTPTGVLGFVTAAKELLDQARGRRLDRIVVAASTGGTVAGLLTGLSALGTSTRITAMCVHDTAEATRRAIGELLTPVARRLGVPVGTSRLELHDACLGEGYGIPDTATIDAVRQVARLEGLLLDPVYTGKAMAGLIDLVRSGGIGRDETVVFWHTGGTPALFAYPECWR